MINLVIQTRPFEYLVKYTPQREWIQGRGILLWLSFFFIELGGGMFVVASLFNSLIGMLIGWLICGALGGGFHLLYLGKPLNVIRAFFRLNTSWISRGLFFVSIFLVLGFIYMALAAFTVYMPPLWLLIIINVFAFLTVVYAGFTMNFVNGIPLWNTALLPLFYMAAGFWGGAEMALGVAASIPAATFPVQMPAVTGLGPEIAHDLAYILLIAVILIIAAYLISVRYSSQAGNISVKEIITGKRWPLFWIVVVLIGIVIPVTAVYGSIAGKYIIPMWIPIISGLIGDLAMRYSLLRNGYYAPLTPISDVPTSPV